MHVEDRGLLFDATERPKHERVAAFVSLCRLSSGRLICGFQLGSKKHDFQSTIRFCRSDDDGSTWHELPWRFPTEFDGVPGSLSSSEIVETAPGHLLLYTTWFDRRDPDRPLFDPETEGILHSKQLLSYSSDGGSTWSPWREVPTSGLSGCSSTGPILKWPDGRIALPFESYKEFDDPAPAKHGAWIIVSKDGGRTFGEPLPIAQDPGSRIYYWDQRLCVGTGDDDLIALFWTHDRQAQKDLPVHMRRMSLTANHSSDDSIHNTGIPGQIAAPMMLDDGWVVAFVVDRSGPMTLKLWQSTDGGQTWPAEKSLLIYEHEERAALTQE